jgi:hypothetical protein
LLGGGELLAADLDTGGGQDRQGVGTSVGVDPDDERMSMRDDGHGGQVLPCVDTVRPLRADADLGGSHLGTAL